MPRLYTDCHPWSSVLSVSSVCHPPHHSPPITHHPSLTPHHSPLTTYHSPLTTHHLPLTTHYSPFLYSDGVTPNFSLNILVK